MEFKWLILSFISLMFVICGVIIFVLRWVFISSTDGAIKRLGEDIAKANAKQAELSQKLKEADEELAKRQAEARELANKMRSDAEEESKAEREKIINKAREEGEEIIAKAQGAKEKLKQEMEKEMDVKALSFGMQILNDILSDKAKGSFAEILVNEFLNNLKEVDMSKISPEVKTVEIVTLAPIDDTVKSSFSKVIKEKLNRDISVTASTDPKIGGGVVLKFGSMALDGSIQNLIREKAISLQAQVEAKT